jgi:hypothetical protein
MKKKPCRTKVEPGSHSKGADKATERFFVLPRYSSEANRKGAVTLAGKLSIGVTRRFVCVDLDRRLMRAAVFFNAVGLPQGLRTSGADSETSVVASR